MDAPERSREHQGLRDHEPTGDKMRFFRRKRGDHDETERCPRCREPVPEGAAECMMCGLPLELFRAALRSEEGEAERTELPNR
jgi:hypothetical protein